MSFERPRNLADLSKRKEQLEDERKRKEKVMSEIWNFGEIQSDLGHELATIADIDDPFGAHLFDNSGKQAGGLHEANERAEEIANWLNRSVDTKKRGYRNAPEKFRDTQSKLLENFGQITNTSRALPNLSTQERQRVDQLCEDGKKIIQDLCRWAEIGLMDPSSLSELEQKRVQKEFTALSNTYESPPALLFGVMRDIRFELLNIVMRKKGISEQEWKDYFDSQT